MTEQETLWQGEFGNAYLQRNRVDWHKRVRFWREIVDKTRCQSALEIGCNAGWNLHALSACGVTTLVGLDINNEAVQEAQRAGLHVVHGTPDLCDSSPHKFDLVFTAGVLIHVAPEHLRKTMESIANASTHYVLAVEYDAPTEERVEYRGQKDALWKRPYGELYSAMGLMLTDSGSLSERDGFDNTTYWLLCK